MKNNILEKTVINAPKDKVKVLIYDLKHWHTWSPFDTTDTEAVITYSDEKDGLPKRMDWNGKINGVGFMEIESIKENATHFHLEFIKPFKSKAKTSFQIRELDNKSLEVSWDTQGHLPFFLFFMKKFFNKMLSNDFRRGLKRLKTLTETGKIPARLEYQDSPQNIDAFSLFLDKAEKIHIKDLPQVMGKMIGDIQHTLSEMDVSFEEGFCFYDKVDFLKDTFNFRVGHTVKNTLTHEKVTEIPSHKAIKVTLYGSYDFLEDAWKGIMMHFRALKYKPNKKVPPYEKYIKHPQNVSNEEEYVTEIYMPVK